MYTHAYLYNIFMKQFLGGIIIYVTSLKLQIYICICMPVH